jgi:hypothetical protein
LRPSIRFGERVCYMRFKMLDSCGTGQSHGTLANPADPIKACGSSGEEISPFRRACASREPLAGVPVDGVGEAFLVRRKIAFKHGTARSKGFDAGLDIGTHGIRHRLGGRRLGLLLESETVNGLAKSADFDVNVFVCGEGLDRRGPAWKFLLQLARIRAYPDRLPTWLSTIFVSGKAPARLATSLSCG